MFVSTTHLIRKLLLALGVIIILLAFAMTVARLTVPHLARYREAFAHVASLALGQSVEIKRLDVAWHDIWPVIDASGVTIAGDKGTHIQHIRASINIFASLWHRTVILSQVQFVGLNVAVRQTPTGYIINHWTIEKGKTGDSGFLATLLQQGTLSFSDVNLLWEDADREITTHINFLTLQNRSHTYILSGDMSLLQPFLLHFKFRVQATGDIQNLSTLQAHAYVNINPVKLYALLGDRVFYGERVTRGTLQGRVWFSLANGQVSRVQSILQLHDLGLKSPYQRTHIPSITANVAWEALATGWQLSGDNVLVKWKDHTWPANQFLVRVTPEEQSAQVAYFKLEDVLSVLKGLPALPRDIASSMIKLNPQGVLKDVVVTHHGTEWTANTVQASGTFHHVSLEEWRRVPALHHLTGQFYWANDDAELALASHRAFIYDKQLFTNPVYFDQLYGMVALHIAPDFHMTIHSLYFNNADLSVAAQGNLQIVDKIPHVDLLLHTHVNRLDHIMQDMPAVDMSPHFVEWAKQAFTAGQADADVLLHGIPDNMPMNGSLDTFLVDAKIHDTAFHFSPSWLPIDHFSAHVMMQDAALSVDDVHGYLLKNSLTDVSVLFPDIKRSEVELNLKGQVLSTLEQAEAVLMQSPLRHTLAEPLANLHLKGQAKLALQLQVYLAKDNVRSAVHGTVDVDEGSATLTDQHIPISHLVGQVVFNDQGVSSHAIQGEFMHAPMNFSLETLAQDNLGIRANGTLDIDEASHLFQVPLKKYAMGKTPFNMFIRIPMSTTTPTAPIVMQLHSSLQGIAVKLPAPLGKTAEEALPTNAMMFVVGDHLQAVKVDANQAAAASLSWDNAEHLAVDVTMPSIDWSVWKPYVIQDNADHNQSKLVSVTVHAQDITAYTQHVQHAMLTLIPMTGAWSMKIESDTIQGHIIIPNDIEQGTLQGNFKKLMLVFKTNADATRLKPTDFPNINITADDFIMDAHDLGKTSVAWHKAGDALMIDHMNIQSKPLTLNLKGEWIAEEHSDKTELTGEVSTESGEQLFKEWDLHSSLLPQKGSVKFSLSWVGDPSQWNLDTLKGHLDTDVGQGRIVNLGSKTNQQLDMGRLLNALSIQSILNKLSFNFSDMKEGYNFTSLKGAIDVDQGNLMTRDATFKGPVADLWFAGRIGLVTHDFDGHLNVTPHVTSSLPVVAGLVNPVLGIASFVADKVFAPEINKLTTYHYLLKGTFEKPDLIALDQAAGK